MSKKEQVLLEEIDSEKPKNLKKAVHYFFELLMLQKKKTIPAILSNFIEAPGDLTASISPSIA